MAQKFRKITHHSHVFIKKAVSFSESLRFSHKVVKVQFIFGKINIPTFRKYSKKLSLRLILNFIKISQLLIKTSKKSSIKLPTSTRIII